MHGDLWALVIIQSDLSCKGVIVVGWGLEPRETRVGAGSLVRDIEVGATDTLGEGGARELMRLTAQRL